MPASTAQQRAHRLPEFCAATWQAQPASAPAELKLPAYVQAEPAPSQEQAATQAAKAAEEPWVPKCQSAIDRFYEARRRRAEVLAGPEAASLLAR